MFRGLKNAVKGGISVVNEKGSDLAGSVVGDPDLGTSSLKNRLKDGAKNIGKGGSQFVEQGTENFNETVGTERVEGSKELAKDVVHNAKHYGAFGENFLGYSDPTKDLRKAVKAKEKAAKKAKKEKKKKGGKTEDLFDPENLAKYKAELEEKRRIAAEASPGGFAANSTHSPVCLLKISFIQALLRQKSSQLSQAKVRQISRARLSLKPEEDLSTRGDSRSQRVQTLSLRVPLRQKKK